jgi:DNA/RNA endonuclease YhcR with UshA esterase domain
MRLLILAFLSLSFLTALAQIEVKPEELKDHIGDSVKVTGKISGIRYLESAKNSPTLINIGGTYPNQVYTIVIFGEVRKKLGYAPEESKYAGGMAIVTGKVELYKGKPQIVITDPAQLQILYDEEVPAGKLPTIKQN